MSRVARVVVPGIPHHVTQRGNRKAAVFLTASDASAYLALLRRACGRYGVSIWAYCLMPNHVHLVAVPQGEDSLAMAMRDTHTAYAMRFNRRTGLTGHLWQGRFYSCPLDARHLWAAVRYVERNPVRAGLVERAEDHRWSSAAAHGGLRVDPLLAPGFPPRDAVADWAAWLSNAGDHAEIAAIRRNTHTGRPCGAPDFVCGIEAAAQRPLSPRKRGRKPGTPRPGGSG